MVYLGQGYLPALPGIVLGVSDRVLVMGEGRLRGDFINDGLSQETVLAAALDQRPAPNATTANKEPAA